VSLLTLAAATALLVDANLVDIRSSTHCPSGEEIAARLRPMLPSGWSVGPSGDLVLVEVVEPGEDGVTGFHLQLLRPEGSMGGDRRLLLEGGCPEMADAIATVIAAWETDFVAAAPRQGPVPVAPAPPTQVAQRPAPPPAGLGFSLGASVGAVVVDGVAATAGLEASAGRQASRWRLRVAGTAQTNRRKTLDVGEVRWNHTTIAAGLVLRSLGPSWHYSIDAGPAAGWVTLAGHGYAPDRTESVFEYGLAGGLRAERALGRFAVWLDLRTTLWAESQQAVLTGSSNRGNLPRIDIWASLGVSVASFH
jgi:hypothetical protein